MCSVPSRHPEVNQRTMEDEGLVRTCEEEEEEEEEEEGVVAML